MRRRRSALWRSASRWMQEPAGKSQAPPGASERRGIAWRRGALAPSVRMLAEECAIAVTYGRATHAVMLATPTDLEDFAVGFSLSERVVAAPEEIAALAAVPVDAGIELRMDLVPERADLYAGRRRMMAGPAGCGLCGADSLQSAMPLLQRVAADLVLSPEQVLAAVASLDQAQRLNAETHGVHAAGFWMAGRRLVALREDVGRHNALDKLIGALARQAIAPARGVVAMTSRVSVELVQKVVHAGAPILVAMSAPSALAVRLADSLDLTLVAVARQDGFEIFSHPERIRAPRQRKHGSAPDP